jgi:virginiamycin B lyase
MNRRKEMISSSMRRRWQRPGIPRTALAFLITVGVVTTAGCGTTGPSPGVGSARASSAPSSTTPAVSAAPSPHFISYVLPSSSNPLPTQATLGPDGAIWYTDRGNPLRIGRISATGEVTTYPLPGGVQYSGPDFITSGPDGGLWFTRNGQADLIARMSVSGHYSDYALPPHLTGPTGIVAGPDGALWFTESVGNRIGRITPSGQVREYTLPSAADAQCGQLCPGDITVGPDGALWFVNTQLVGVPGIGRITTGGAITLYSLPARSVPGYSGPVVRQVPTAITAGPDGNLWFAEDRGPGLGRITPGGRITEFDVPGLQQTAATVRALTAGPDGAVWFTLAQAVGELNPSIWTRPGQLGRVASDGSVILFTPPGQGTTGPIVLGKDGSLWAFSLGAVTRVALG